MSANHSEFRLVILPFLLPPLRSLGPIAGPNEPRLQNKLIREVGMHGHRGMDLHRPASNASTEISFSLIALAANGDDKLILNDARSTDWDREEWEW
jgi:hypothetical protein